VVVEEALVEEAIVAVEVGPSIDGATIFDDNELMSSNVENEPLTDAPPTDRTCIVLPLLLMAAVDLATEDFDLTATAASASLFKERRKKE
jgi:hypothetical protein